MAVLTTVSATPTTLAVTDSAVPTTVDTPLVIPCTSEFFNIAFTAVVAVAEVVPTISAPYLDVNVEIDPVIWLSDVDVVDPVIVLGVIPVVAEVS